MTIEATYNDKIVVKKVVSDRIVVKKVIVGTPIKRVKSGSFTLNNLGGVDVSATESDGSILSYNPTTSNYEVTNLRTDANISLVFDSAANTYTWGLIKNLDSANIISLGGVTGVDASTTSTIRGLFSAGGDLSYDSSTGAFSFDVEQVYTKTNFDSDLGDALDGGTGISYDSSTDTVSISDTGVIADTYGSATHIPVFTVNAQGQLDSAGTVAVAGVTSFDFDSANGNLTIGTADGASFVTTTTLDPFSTTNLSEGSNLYYTTARADSDAKNSISVTDVGGDGSLSYDNTTGVITYTGPSASEVRSHFSASGDLSYESSTGVFSFDVEQVYTKVNFDSDLGLANTGQLPEGTNLYYTTTRADSDFDAKLATVATDSNIGSAIVARDSSGDFYAGNITATGITATGATFTGHVQLTDDQELRLGNGSNGSDLKIYHNTGNNSTYIREGNPDGSLVIQGSNLFLANTSGEKYLFGIAGGRTELYYDGDRKFETVSGGARVYGDLEVRGKVTQDSAVSKGIQFLPQSTAFSQTAGSLYFDSEQNKGLSVRLRTPENANPDVSLNVGQETFLYVYNDTGAQIDNGDAIYISGTHTDGTPKVTLARANASTSSAVFGLATMNIPDDAHGWVTRYGLVRDVNTAGMTPGNTLFLSADSAGVVTETPVTVDTGFPHHIGRVITADASNGMILVDGMSEHFDDLRVENKFKTSQLVADSASLLNVQFDTSTFDSHQPYSEGLLFYDNEHKTLNYYNDINGTQHPIEIGMQEHQRVFNNTGATIKKGTALYFNGNYTSGAQDVPTVALANASSSSAYNAQGLASHDIPNNTYGMLLLQGQLTEINTSAVTASTQFFVSATTSGEIQSVAPSYPNFPMCMGWVVVSGDSDNGVLMVNRENHSVNSFRVTQSAHIGADLQVDGNLTILGSQTTVGTSNVTQGSPMYRLNEGDTIGEAGTSFQGSGLDDAFFGGHFKGTAGKNFYVKIDGTGTPDTFEWGYDSASPQATGLNITGSAQSLSDNIDVEFSATTGHTSGDKWTGSAAPVNVDTGFFTNRNTGSSGVGYTHAGIFFDTTDEKWKLIDEYDSTPTGTINTADASFGLATLVADTFEGNLTGAVTGNASTASALASGQNFSITGDVTATDVSFDGTGAVALNAAITADTIINADIKSDAAIADTKLATISTVGKVNNSATTATNANTGSAIVARDASGNFSAGTITADFDRSASTTVTAGTYGSNTAIPVLTIDSNGFVDSAGTVSVAGVTGLDFDSTNGTLTISTTGTSYSDVLTLDPYSTTDLTEGTNLYYTTARADSDAKNAVSASGDLSYDPSTGVFSFDVEEVYTKANFDSDFDVALASKSTTNVSEGTNLYYTTARADSDAKNSVSVTDAGGDGSLSYSSATGVFTYTGASAAETRAHFTANKGLSVTSGQFNIDSANVKGMFSGGTGVTYSDGAISIGQDVATTSNVTFNGLEVDSAHIDNGHLRIHAPALTSPGNSADALLIKSNNNVSSPAHQTDNDIVKMGQYVRPGDNYTTAAYLRMGINQSTAQSSSGSYLEKIKLETHPDITSVLGTDLDITGILNVNPATDSDTITIGSTSQNADGIITLGRSTKDNTINIGNAATDSDQEQIINIGSGTGEGTSTVNIASKTSQGNHTAVNIGGNDNSSGTATVAIRGTTTFTVGDVDFNGSDFNVTPVSAAREITIGSSVQEGTITLGRSTSTNTINIGNAQTADGKTQTINIGGNNQLGGDTVLNLAANNSTGSDTTVTIGNSSSNGTHTVAVRGTTTFSNGDVNIDDNLDVEGTINGKYNTLVNSTASGYTGAIFKSHAGKKIIKTGTASITIDDFQPTADDIGKHWTIVNATTNLSGNVNLDFGGQYVRLMNGASAVASQDTWIIGRGGVAELVCIAANANGGSTSGANFILYGNDIST